MKYFLLTLFVSFMVILVQCEDVKVKVDTKALFQPRFIRASKRFYVSTETATFVGAMIACKTGGMNLATIDNENAQGELANVTGSATYRSSDGYWIGAASANIYASNSFYWVNNGIRLIYTNWGSYQPRYINGLGYGGCVRMGNFYKVNQQEKWSSYDCNRLLNYVCEF